MDYAGLNALDTALLKLINSPAGESMVLDAVVRRIAQDLNFKGILVVAFMWGLWFCHRRLGPDTREKLLATFVATMAAIAAARLLALLLPMRERPIVSYSDELNPVLGFDSGDLGTWSSFPSDHATMFFALAMGLFMVSRVAGIAAFIHAAIIISLPRIYLGLHFPSDILGGAMLGVLTSLVLVPPIAAGLVRLDVLRWSRQQPMVFYGMLYFFTFQLANQFNLIRTGFSAVYVMATGGVT